MQQPDIVIWRCVSHQLGLAVRDCVAERHYPFQNFIDTIYALFIQSPKDIN
jgi:hypothetical protein